MDLRVGYHPPDARRSGRKTLSPIGPWDQTSRSEGTRSSLRRQLGCEPAIPGLGRPGACEHECAEPDGWGVDVVGERGGGVVGVSGVLAVDECELGGL